MCDGPELVLPVLLIVVSVFFIFAAFSSDTDSPSLFVPKCDHPASFYVTTNTNDESATVITALANQGWTHITRVEHFWTDDISAQCEAI